MTLKKSMIEVMTNRQSIRNFDLRPIAEEDYIKIKDYMNTEENFISPFGSKGRVELVEVSKNVTDKGIKLGTYGFIKNPRAYLVGIAENEKYPLVEFAYTFHKLVLFVTELGMGTCWMGGTFNRNSFEQEISIDTGNFIPCITPIGYPHDKKRIFDKAIRAVVKADNKKPWDKLFYDTSFHLPLNKEKASALQIPIEMVRLGPSASNKQPWRLVLSKDGSRCDFYIEHTPNYSSKLGYDMQLLDMGIAMCQFEMACKELNIVGTWMIDDSGHEVPNEHTEYIVSWMLA